MGPPGTPSGDPPGAPPAGPPPAPGNFPGAPPGPPRAPRPGAPRGPPPGTPLWGPPGPINISFCTYIGVFGGSRRGAPGGPPGGAKKCTFFWVFNNSPSRDKNLHFFSPRGAPGQGAKMGGLGGYRGVADWDRAYSTAGTAIWLGLVPKGRALRRDPRAALRAWGVRSARRGTSLKARDGSPAQGRRRCESDEAVCESQTRPEERSAARGPP